MERFSIDCKNVNVFRSNDNLPFINPNSKERNIFSIINEDKMQKTHSRNFSLNKKANRPHLNELKHVKTSFKRFNSIELKNNNNSKNTISTPIEKEKEQQKEKIKRKSKFYSFKNLDFKNNINTNNNNNNINFEIESTKKNKLTSKMLPKITGFEEFNMDLKNNNNIRETNNQSNINKNKKHYKLKNIINNLEIKVSLPEEEINKNKDSNKKLEVF